MERTKLATARYEKGWSQEEVAERVGVTRNTFSKWERGKVVPYPIHVHRLCQLFGKTAEELNLVNTQSEAVWEERVDTEKHTRKDPLYDEVTHTDGNDMLLHRFSQAIAQGILQTFTEPGIQDLSSFYHQLGKLNMDEKRRLLLQVLSTSAAAIAGFRQNPLLSVTNLLQDLEHTAFFEQQLASLWNVYHTGGTLQADYQLKMLLATYNESTIPKYASETLCMSYQLQGSLYRDMMKYDDAHTFYKQAFEVAKELNDSELMASALARRGVTYIQQSTTTTAVEYLNEAHRLIKDYSLPFLSGYILQALSEAYALAQHSEKSDQYLDMAQQALIPNGNYLERSHCQANTTSITAQKGVNAVHLHNYTAAITLIDQGMATYNPTFVRGRARLKAQQSEAYYGLGDIDACCQSATEAWLLARAASSNRIFTRLRKLQLDLVTSSQKKNTSVIDLNWVMATV
jgi:transcriptional regulator with XRE-family HTH domain